MSITDELRSWAEGDALRAGMSLRTARDQALAIADRIDAEHERQLGVLYRDMSDAEWVRLPVDADGVPIRFKDKVTVPWSDKVYEVSGFSYQENVHTGTMTIWINTHVDGEYRALCATDSCHHHAPDTWESITYDAMQAGRTDITVDVSPLIARRKALCERTKGGDAE